MSTVRVKLCETWKLPFPPWPVQCAWGEASGASTQICTSSPTECPGPPFQRDGSSPFLLRRPAPGVDRLSPTFVTPSALPPCHPLPLSTPATIGPL